MTALSREQAAHFEGLIDAYEQQREDAQTGLKDTLADLREALGKLIDKSEIAAEVAGLRGAVKRRRMERNAPEKAKKTEEKLDLADQYYFLLQSVPTESIARPHSAQRASRIDDLGQTEPVTPHDPVTGEIAAFNELEELVSGPTTTVEELEDALDLPRGSISEHGDTAETTVAASGAPDNSSGTDAAAPETAVETAPIAAACADINGGGAPAQPDGGEDDTAGLIPALDSQKHIDTPARSIGSASGLSVQVHRNLSGEPFYPDPTNLRIKNITNEPDLPPCLKRATTTQEGHA